MKNTTLYILFVCLFASIGWGYTYTITEYQYLPDLTGTQSMFVTDQGGGGGFFAEDNSSITVENTSTLDDGTGGLWEINLIDSSYLDFSGGELGTIIINHDATAFLSGGLIQQILSYQSAWKQEGEPLATVPNPHITIECLDYSHNTTTNLLTGHWLDDGLAFSIQLVDVGGYDPAIENIQFIPEPATLMLLGLGGLMMKKKH